MFTCTLITLFGQTTVTIYPTASSMNTGWVNSAGTKTSGDMQVSTSTSYGRGWAKFPLSSIPSNASITSVVLKFYTYGNTANTVNTIRGFIGNPVTMTGTTLYTTIGNGSVYNSSVWTNGTSSNPFLNTLSLSANAFIESQMATGYVNFGFDRGGASLYSIYGFANSSYKVRLEVTYSNCNSSSIVLYPLNTSMSSGFVTSNGTKNSGNIQAALGTAYGRGWAKFPLTAIPNGTVITNVKLNFYAFGESSPTSPLKFIRGFTGDPVSMSGSDLYSLIGEGITYNSSIWGAGTSTSPVLNSYDLNAEDYVQSQLSTGYVNFGFLSASTNLVTIYGYSNVNYKMSLEITYGLNTDVSIIANGDTTFCQGNSVDLSTNSGTGYMYQWKKNGLNINGATSMDYNASTTGLYSVNVTNNFGCSNISREISVVVNPLPTSLINSNGNTTYCEGNFLTLNANLGSGLSYQWRNNDININGAVSSSYNAITTGAYSVIVTNNFGCNKISNVINTLVYPSIFTTILSDGNTDVCEGDSVMLMSSNYDFYTYKWMKNNTYITDATNPFYYANSEGIYSLIISDTNGCINISDNYISVSFLPKPTLEIQGDNTICIGDTTTLVAISEGNITWNGVLNQNSIVVSPTSNTIYSIVSLGVNECKTEDQITVYVDYPSDTTIYISSYGPLNLNGQIFQESGVYIQNLESFGGCDSTLTIHLNYIANSLLELKDFGIVLYPNPSKDCIIYINSSNEFYIGEIIILNSLGLVVDRLMYKDVLDLSNLANGMYWIQFNIEGNTFYEKIIKG